MVAFLPCHFGWLFLFQAVPTKWNWKNFRYHYSIPGDCVLMCMFTYNYIGTATRFCTLDGVWETVNIDNCTREVFILLNDRVRLLHTVAVLLYT